MTKAIIPYSLKDAPALIEHIWPTGKISAEVQKERKANLGQTLLTRLVLERTQAVISSQSLRNGKFASCN